MEFVSAVPLNTLNDRLWTDRGYHSTWLLQDGRIEATEFWEHIEMACGVLWMPNSVTEFPADTCHLYWQERGGLLTDRVGCCFSSS